MRISTITSKPGLGLNTEAQTTYAAFGEPAGGLKFRVRISK